MSFHNWKPARAWLLTKKTRYALVAACTALGGALGLAGRYVVGIIFKRNKAEKSKTTEQPDRDTVI